MSSAGQGVDVAAVENALRRLSHAFAYCMDYFQYDALLNLFTPDAILGRVLEVHHGHAEIRSGLEQRSRKIVTRHVTTNFFYDIIDTETVRGVVYNMSHFGAVVDGELPVAYGAAHSMLLDFHDLYKFTSTGWKFAERIARPVLLPANSPMDVAEVRWRQSDVVKI